jgi:sugar phosphate isomerase/epimerase
MTSPFGMNTYSYTISHGVESCVEHLARQGYDTFELMMYPGHLWPAEMDAAARRALARRLRAMGVRVVTLNMPNIDLNLAGAAREMRAYTLEILRGVLQLAGDLGVPGVVVGPGKSNPLYPAPRDRLIGYFHAALDELVPLARKVGTGIWAENMPFAFLSDAKGLMEVLAEYGAEDVGVVYDVANAVFIREDLREGLQAVQPRLKLVHLSDTGHAAYRHDPVGKGVVPWTTIPRLLAEVGYTEKPVLEIISAENPDGDIRDSAARLAGLGWQGEARAA